MLSSFTLISLTGVMLGVLVLVVVMSVYAGLERDFKSRLLGFTPHVLLHYYPSEAGGSPVEDWRTAAESAAKLPGVLAATAYISDNVIIDVGTYQRPIMIRGVETTDPEQVKGIASLLDLKSHPESSADLGIDDRVIISSIVAEQFGIGVGDTIRLYSTRNFDRVLLAAKESELAPMREIVPDQWTIVTDALAEPWTPGAEEGSATIEEQKIYSAYAALNAILETSEPDFNNQPRLRSEEHDLLIEIIISLENAERDDETGNYLLSAEQQQTVRTAIAALEATDRERMDGNIFKNIKTFILPKEAVVSGVYLASQMAVTPDVFAPLPLAQTLAGLDDAVQGIALRLNDAYAAEQFAAIHRPNLPADWRMVTWGDTHQAFFGLINQQRVMMYFALSFIVLVSAFSMMAVMFTVTIQKRREIGVMKALGAAPGQIVRVFLYQGMILGVLGAALGVGLGHLVIYFRGGIQSIFRGLGFDPFSASFTGFDTLPAYHDPVEQLLIAVMAFVLCSFAALVPAFFAARSDAAKSLRNL
jgi:lipoprotein-releasing system permease protein